MSRYKPDRQGIGEMLRSPEMQAHMLSRAEKIAGAARPLSPVTQGDEPELEHYRDSFEVTSGTRPDRAYGRVENTSDHAAAIEFSNFRTRKKTINAQHVLGRSIDAARG